MKNFKYVALTALLLSFMLAGCGWNPFRKKPVATEPPIVDIATIDNTGVGTDPVRPDTGVDASRETGTDVAKTGGDTTTPVPPPAAGTTYTIKKKDTLWSIAVAYLGDGQRWRDILAANPGLNEKKLAIGQTIKLPPK